MPSNKIHGEVFLYPFTLVILIFYLFSTTSTYAGLPQPYQALATNTTSIDVDQNTAGEQVRNNNSTFLTYQDPIYGIKIGYPSDWNKTEGANFVEFRLPAEDYNRTTTTANITGLIALEITVDILPPSIASLEQYSRAKLIVHRQYGEFNLLESNTTIIAANVPALKTVYTNTFQKTGEVLKTMEITAIRDNIGYDIRYFADPASDYPKYFPIIHDMISSFEFIGLIES